MNSKLVMWTVIAMLFMMIFACSDEDDSSTPTVDDETGRISLRATDAPIDDAGVQSAVVTISKVYVDGEQIEGYNKTTVDLLAYQNGSTYDLGTYDIDADSYSTVTLELDMSTTADGESPGCYVLNADGQKHSLITSNGMLQLQADYEVMADQQTELIFDFDLRKAIREGQDNMDDYDFVAQAALENSIRVIHGDDQQVVSGQVTGLDGESDVVVAYLYEKGTFSSDTEVVAETESQIAFPNAITSTTVDADGRFEMHFIPEGDYELQLAAYQYDMEGEAQLDGMITLGLDGVLGSILGGIEITVDGDTELQLTAEGYIGIFN